MITIRNITKKFGKLNALDDVSAAFAGGECIALLGPNGSGKTTLIKSLLGMIRPTDGVILFDGADISGKWLYRNRIGYMPQIGRYPENMTIGQLIQMMKDIRKSHGASYDEDLIRSFLPPQIMNKRMRMLSGGTTQKVSAVLAFLFSPDILILDEPTAGLDPLASELLKQKIVTEKQNGKLIIITSHILSELDDIVTEVLYMHEGKLLFHKKLSALRQETGEQKLSRAIAKVMVSM